MKTQRKFRSSPRKSLTKTVGKDSPKLTIDSLSSAESLQKFAKYGLILEASASGILMQFKREDFVAKELRSTLNLDTLVGKHVYVNIHEMNLEISGKVARTKFLGKDGFLVAIDYTEDAPEYWRECLIDLLPTG